MAIPYGHSIASDLLFPPALKEPCLSPGGHPIKKMSTKEKDFWSKNTVFSPFKCGFEWKMEKKAMRGGESDP